MLAQKAMEGHSSRELRLDPFQLPHKVRTTGENNKVYSIDRNGAVLKKQLNCGLPISVALPNKAFQGVAAKAIELEDGIIKVSLELSHHDKDCCLPLLISDNLDDIAADWHAWSRMLKLPMLIIDQNGNSEALQKQLGEIMVEAPIERRKRFSFLKHRPNFLRRRKVGVVSVVERITAEEIIARR